MEKPKDWFESWFDSPYYHSLYKHRDQAEAEDFLGRLVKQLGFDRSGKLLDIACGRGRHALYLNRCGFDVSAFDISPASITFDKQFENERLHFFLHDMRKPFKKDHFDYALNLFSSFGYFEDDKESQASLQAAADNLRPGGTFVFDYANMHWVIRHALNPHTEVNDGIHFNVTKRLDDRFVVKSIEFEAEGKPFRFEERLRSFTPEELRRMISATGLEIIHEFGDYALGPFSPENSQRWVIAAMKK